MRVVFFGTPQFAVPSLKSLIESGEDIAAVVTQEDKRKGRGHFFSQPPVKELAISRMIRVLQPPKMSDKAFLEALFTIKPDLIIVVAYGRILPESVLNLPPLGCLNVHASLLPRYRGAAPIQWAIINGEKTTGVTTMLMGEGLDTGDILLQEDVKISDDDTTETLGMKLSEAGATLLLKTVRGIKETTIKPRPQAGTATFAPIIKKEDGRLAWSKTAVELLNFVRGMYPWPGAYCYLNGERIKLIKVNVLDGSGEAGRVENAGDEGLVIGTARGLLEIKELQPEGKKIMTAAAFLHGRNIKKGTYFDEV